MRRRGKNALLLAADNKALNAKRFLMLSIRESRSAMRRGEVKRRSEGDRQRQRNARPPHASECLEFQPHTAPERGLYHIQARARSSGVFLIAFRRDAFIFRSGNRIRSGKPTMEIDVGAAP